MSICVDILLATHNGAQFLKEQLQSVLNQTYDNWRLLIHDDGSVDCTVKIIREFEVNDSRISLLDDGKVFSSASDNFIHLLRQSTSELVIFCDQDDVWFADKLDFLVKAIHAKTQPCAVYCNSYFMIGSEKTAIKVTHFERSDLKSSLFLNGGVQGNSLLFNRKLIEKLGVFPDHIYMHDHFITIAAITFGELVYLDLPLMYYRQHSGNVTGNLPKSFLERATNFFKSEKYVVHRGHYNANEIFYNHYYELISPIDRAVFQAYFRYIGCKNLIIRLIIINRFKFRIGNNRFILILKTILRKPISS